MEEQEKLKHLVTGLSILLPTMLLLGIIGTWFFMDLKLKDTKSELEKIKTEMQDTKEEESKTDKPKSDNEEYASNLINFNTIKVGDKVGAFVVKSIEPANPQFSSLNENNLKIEFIGEAQITGYYEYYPNKEDALFADQVFFIADQSSDNLIPKMSTTEQTKRIGFSNLERIKELLGLGAADKEGKATIKIDGYTLISYPSSGFDYTTIIEVINK